MTPKQTPRPVPATPSPPTTPPLPRPELISTLNNLKRKMASDRKEWEAIVENLDKQPNNLQQKVERALTNLHKVIRDQKATFELLTTQMNYMKETQDKTMHSLAELQHSVSRIIQDQVTNTPSKAKTTDHKMTQKQND